MTLVAIKPWHPKRPSILSSSCSLEGVLDTGIGFTVAGIGGLGIGFIIGVTGGGATTGVLVYILQINLLLYLIVKIKNYDKRWSNKNGTVNNTFKR